MLHGYRGMHEEHLDPVEEAPEVKGEEEEEDDEDRPVIRKTVTKKTPSPYTHNTGMHFANLAQSYVHGVGAYEPNKKADGSSVSEYLGDLPEEIEPKDVLSLVSAPSFKSFNKKFSAKVPEDDKRADEARTNLWSTSQLLDLESARRRSGGVMNAVGITQDLATDDPDAKKRLVEKNVLSHKKASGKSIDPNPGKLQRLNKSNDVMTALLSGDSHPDLDRLRKRMHSFVETAPKHASFKKAKAAWQDAAEIQKGGMKRGVSQELEDDKHLGKLKAAPAFGELQGSFADFMRGYYDPEARNPKNKNLDTKKTTKALKGDHFLTWMINKAASAGHQDVLDEASEPHRIEPGEENEEDPTSRHEASEFLTMFGANKDPKTATKLQHVANLRRAHEISKGSEVFGKYRIHANNRGRHFRPGFGRYENLSEEIVEPLEQVYQSKLHGLGDETPRELEDAAKKKPAVREKLAAKEQAGEEKAHEMIRSFVGASNKKQFRASSKKLKRKMKRYARRYKEKEQELYGKYGVQKKARLSVPKRAKLMKDLGIKDEMPDGIDAFRARVKSHAGFRAIEPSQARKSMRALTGLRDVYRTLETDRDPTAGAMNEILRKEGFAAKDKPLDPNALLNTFNIMSPQGVNNDSDIKSKQFTAVRRGVKLAGSISKRQQAIGKKRKKQDFKEEDIAEDSRKLDKKLRRVFRKRLKGNDGEAVNK
jgi:hypothetical protein